MKPTDFLNDLEARVTAAREKGAVAAERNLPRECEFNAPELRDAWFAGYDRQKARQPKLWGNVSKSSTP